MPSAVVNSSSMLPSGVIPLLCTLGLTVERHFCSIFKHKCDARGTRRQSQSDWRAHAAPCCHPLISSRNVGEGGEASGLRAGARLHNSQSQHVNSREQSDHQQYSARLSMDETDQRLGTCQKFGFHAKRLVAKIG